MVEPASFGLAGLVLFHSFFKSGPLNLPAHISVCSPFVSRRNSLVQKEPSARPLSSSPPVFQVRPLRFAASRRCVTFFRLFFGPRGGVIVPREPFPFRSSFFLDGPPLRVTAGPANTVFLSVPGADRVGPLERTGCAGFFLRLRRARGLRFPDASARFSRFPQRAPRSRAFLCPFFFPGFPTAALCRSIPLFPLSALSVPSLLPSFTE